MICVLEQGADSMTLLKENILEIDNHTIQQAIPGPRYQFLFYFIYIFTWPSAISHT